MALFLSMQAGFITNSSSVVYHFPKEALDHPQIKAFLERYGITNGFVGENLWHRGRCGSVAINREQKQEVLDKLRRYDYSFPNIEVENEDFAVIVYGDEYTSLASTLSELLQNVCEDMRSRMHGEDYN